MSIVRAHWTTYLPPPKRTFCFVDLGNFHVPLFSAYEVQIGGGRVVKLGIAEEVATVACIDLIRNRSHLPFREWNEASCLRVRRS